MRKPHPIVEVVGATGGVGASVLAWFLGVTSGGFLLDASAHTGGIAWIGRGGQGLWPRAIGSEEPETLVDLMGRTAEVEWFSGGQVPELAVVARVARSLALIRPVIVELPSCQTISGHRILLTSNRLRDWLWETPPIADQVVVRRMLGGLSSQELAAQQPSETPLTFYDDDRALLRNIELGSGGRSSRKLERIAQRLWQGVCDA